MRKDTNNTSHRYADDITLSASFLPKCKSIGNIKYEVISIIRKNGFVENDKKIRIGGPGSRKRVLGLLVDGDKPKISKDFHKRLDRFFYSIERFGIEAVAKFEKFESVFGFFNHLSGLMSYLHDVDVGKWGYFSPRFQNAKYKFSQTFSHDNSYCSDLS